MKSKEQGTHVPGVYGGGSPLHGGTGPRGNSFHVKEPTGPSTVLSTSLSSPTDAQSPGKVGTEGVGVLISVPFTRPNHSTPVPSDRKV